MNLPKKVRNDIEIELVQNRAKKAAELLARALDISPIPINTSGHASASKLARRIFDAYRELKFATDIYLIIIFDRLTSSSRHERALKGHTARKGEKRRDAVQAAALLGLQPGTKFNKSNLARKAKCHEKHVRNLIKDDTFWQDVLRESMRQERAKQKAKASPIIAAVRARLATTDPR